MMAVVFVFLVYQTLFVSLLNLHSFIHLQNVSLCERDYPYSFFKDTKKNEHALILTIIFTVFHTTQNRWLLRYRFNSSTLA
jgi:outer membrane lipopolysaccharide assembly protein LptE/RlpB